MNESFGSQPAAPQPSPAPAAAPPPPPVAAAGPVTIIERKSPKAAGWLSVLFPGVGLLYLGLYQRAFTLAAATIFCIFMNAHGGGTVFGPLTFFVWIFGIIDAVQQARAINRSQIPAAVYAPSSQVQKLSGGTGWLTLGVIMTGIGALWLADNYLDLERFFEVLPTWGGPAAFILLGLVLIIGHVRKQRAENEANSGMPPRSQ